MCTGSFVDCNGNVGDGCEANTQSDLGNCGGCGQACAPPYATPRCSSGMCQIVTCSSGRANCNGDLADGCESALATDPMNCGTCNKMCPSYLHAASICSSSSCAMGPCVAGYTDCNSNSSDGCETNTGSDPKNCGGCGQMCATPPNAFPSTCSMGSCVVNCKAPYGNCDGSAANGCETLLSDDINHCGTCTTICQKVSQGLQGCVGGKCSILQCAFPFADCNKIYADGCEVDVRSSNTNCGACNNSCPPGKTCVAATCR
jgi:hypothetical protein